MPTRVGNLPSVDSINDKTEWTKETALRIFYKYIYPTQVDAESKAIRNNLISWFYDTDDWLANPELSDKFDEAEFDRINKEALTELGNHKLETIWKKPEKFGVTSTKKVAEKDESGNLTFREEKIFGETLGYDVKGKEHHDDVSILSSGDSFRQIILYDDLVAKAKKHVAKLKKEIEKREKWLKSLGKSKTEEQRKKYLLEVEENRAELKAQEKGIKAYEKKIKKLKESQFDDTITLNAALNNESEALKFYSMYNLNPELDSETAYALALATNYETVRFDSSEEGKQEFEKTYGIPYDTYAKEKKEYEDDLNILRLNLKDWVDSQKWLTDATEQRPADVTSKTMAIAFEERDKERFPKELDYSAYLQSLDDTKWKKHFRDIINNSDAAKELAARIAEGEEQVDRTTEYGRQERVTQSKYNKPEMYEKLIPPRPRKLKESGREEFLSMDRQMDLDTIETVLKTVEDKKRAKSGKDNVSIFNMRKAKRKDRKNQVVLSGRAQFSFIDQYARTIGAKSKEGIRITRREGTATSGGKEPVKGELVFSENMALPQKLLEQLPGLEAQIHYDNITKAMEMYIKRGNKTIDESLNTRLNNILNSTEDGGNNHWYWLSIILKIMNSLEELDADIKVDNHIKSMNKYDKSYWNNRDTKSKFFRNIRKLADGGKGEKELTSNIKDLSLILNDIKSFMIDYWAEEDKDEDEEVIDDEDKITANLKRMTLAELKQMARGLFDEDIKDSIKTMDKEDLVSELASIQHRLRAEEAGGGDEEDEETEVAGDDGGGLLVGAEGQLEQFEEDEEKEKEEEDSTHEIYDTIISTIDSLENQDSDRDNVEILLDRLVEENNQLNSNRLPRVIKWKRFRLSGTDMKKDIRRFVKLVGEDKFAEKDKLGYFVGANAQELREDYFDDTDAGDVMETDEETGEEKVKRSRDTIKQEIQNMLNIINEIWAEHKKDLSEVSADAYDTLLDNIDFTKLLAEKIKTSGLNNIRWGGITLSTKGITIKMDFTNNTLSLNGKIAYEATEEFRPVTQLAGDVPKWQFSAHYMKDSAWQKFRKYSGKNLAPAGGIAQSGKKGAVDADRYKFLTTLITNFNRLNQVVRV
jgi:hypothetical protein